MLYEIVSIYLSILLGTLLSTLLLILLGRSWGPLPIYYLRGVRWIQSFYPQVYPQSEEPWPAIIQRTEKSKLARKPGSTASFSFISEGNGFWNMGAHSVQAGLEAIIQDDFSSAFDRAPSYAETLMRWHALPHWNRVQKSIFYFTLGFRILFLFPVRLSLFISSFIFVTLACIFSYIKVLSKEEKTWIAIVYSRMVCTGLGVVANYKDKHNKPRRPGVAVSNHLTPNDIPIIWAGIEHGDEYGYVLTGQKHDGIIGAMEKLAGRLCPSLWLERKCAKERNDFLSGVLGTAKTGGPIILFPEGYCSNNSQVLQFRKAVFEDGVDIHPMAIRQNGRYGDHYWFEDKFHMYLLRVMTSWAVKYEITYLETMRRLPSESNTEFAARVQAAVAKGARLPVGQLDGGVWYKRSEHVRLREDQQKQWSVTILEELDKQKDVDVGSEDSFCIVDSPPLQTAKPTFNLDN